MERTISEKAYKLNFAQKIYRFIKALIDFLVALIALIILVPVFLVVAIAIKIDSKGPVFFVQKRIGKNGKLFNCIKFRTMSVEARHDIAGYEYKDVNAYITKLGKKLRKLSIDELPQLYNVLTFKMSLIGYRPSQASETELNTARESYNLYQIRPGISGWAQVNGRDVLAAHPQKKAAFDAYYLQNLSLWMDMKILFKTIAQVFKSDGVEEGVLTTEDQETSQDGTLLETSEGQEILENLAVSSEKTGEDIA